MHFVKALIPDGTNIARNTTRIKPGSEDMKMDTVKVIQMVITRATMTGMNPAKIMSDTMTMTLRQMSYQMRTKR